MTTADTEVMQHLPTAAALICGVHDRDTETVHTLLGALDPASLRAVIVLLADMVPDDKSPTELLTERAQDVPRTSDGVPLRREDWTDQECRDAHTAWTHRKERTPWAQVGEREYQRRRKVRRDEIKRVNRQALKVRMAKASAA